MKDATYGDNCERVTTVVRHIHDHLDEHLCIEDLAQVACLSRFHFQRVFCSIAGENTVCLFRRLRLERAAWQLQNTTISITEIALLAGFDSLEGFSRAFRRVFASRATDFREARWLSYWLMTANGTHYCASGTPSFCPLARMGHGIPFIVETVEQYTVFGRKHLGAPHLIGKTCRLFVKELAQSGIDLRTNPIITYAPVLGPATPLDEVSSYVAVRSELQLPGAHLRAVLGGGPHLMVRHVGTGPTLGDCWFRLWKEALPACGFQQGDGPCFQTLQFGLYSNEQDVILAHIYVPLKPE